MNKKINIWEKEGNSTTPLTTMSLPIIQISELEIGICLNRLISFRVSFKSVKRPSTNGDMFHFHISDGSQEIQVTVFAQQCRKFFDVIEFNRTFELSNFNVKPESADFPVFVGNAKYICLLASSKITVLDNSSVPEFKFNYTQIDNIIHLKASSKCDVLGIIGANLGANVVGGNKIKRELVLTDRSKECIELTLWGSDYENFESVGHSVVVHNGIINEFNGTKSINCGKNTLFWHNPQTEDAKSLKSWYDLEMIEFNKG